MTTIQKQGAAAVEAARFLSTCGTEAKNKALAAIADALESRMDEVLAANALDMQAAKKSNMSPALQDRLSLTADRITGIAQSVREVAALPDPIGKVDSVVTRPNGLEIKRVKVPLGVIAIIFEARPNVTVDAAVLCLKSGNASILRSGKEAINSNTAFADIMREAITSVGFPASCIDLIRDTSHEGANELMCLTDYVDVLIPRGGAGLINTVVQNARVPVIKTGVGNCHVYVDSKADLEMGAKIIFNAKCSRPSVCNAAETLLVARDIAKDFLPLAKAELDKMNVELRGCPETQAILGSSVVPATEDDWSREYGDYILAVKLVKDVHEAIEHINRYGTMHSEAIVTADNEAAELFVNAVDAAAVYHNASTRFTDGGEFGLGAEIGISTQKMHARGPMGLEQLTSVKYVISGSGQVR
ncbi:MAG: glutamate-5-semialdehyde dehydrogenase [Oscillospiraceae bacterium]|nr:glutamate-5-semialdehyde dehydrogenase [Oscillospiraceae bacterium]